MDVIARSIGGFVPIYDYQTAKEYAELLLNAQVVVSVFGALSWAFGGINMITFGFTLFAIVALEAGSDRLLRMYTIFVTGMWIMDVVWLALWGTHLHKASVPWYNMGLSEPSTTDKFATVPKFLLAMQSVTFIIRHLQILLWSKMWDLDFGGAGGPGANDPYHNMEAHPSIPPPAAPVQYAHTPGVGDDAYVPPSSGPGPANPPAAMSPAASPYKPPASGPGPAQ